MKSKNIQPVSDKDFDRMFHDKLYSLEVKPTEGLWADISGRVNAEKKKKTIPVLWLTAASMTAVISAGIWLSSQKEPMKLRGTASTEMVAPEPESVKSPLSEETDIIKSNIPEVVSVKVRKPRAKNVLSQPDNKETTPGSHVNTLSVAQTNIAENNIPPDSDTRQLQGNLENNMALKPSQTLALTSETVQEQDMEPEGGTIQRKQKMITSVGSLVNFVVGKVDKRKNKIIEFEDGEEGTMVSGVNLGLLNFKQKNKR